MFKDDKIVLFLSKRDLRISSGYQNKPLVNSGGITTDERQNFPNRPSP